MFSNVQWKAMALGAMPFIAAALFYHWFRLDFTAQQATIWPQFVERLELLLYSSGPLLSEESNGQDLSHSASRLYRIGVNS